MYEILKKKKKKVGKVASLDLLSDPYNALWEHLSCTCLLNLTFGIVYFVALCGSLTSCQLLGFFSRLPQDNAFQL